MKKLLVIASIGCLGVLVLAAVTAVLGLGYVGALPPVSRLMGTDKPRDLGVVVQARDLESAYQKHGFIQVDREAGTPLRDQLEAADENQVGTALTQEELSALIPQHHPLTDFQLRINDDGTVEAAGRLQLGRFPEYAQAISMPPDHVDIFMDTLDRFYFGSGDPVFYIRGQGSVQNNRINMQLGRVEVGRLPLPGGFIRTYNDFIADYASDRLSSVPHHHIESLTFEDGKMLFQGTVPSEIPAY